MSFRYPSFCIGGFIHHLFGLLAFHLILFTAASRTVFSFMSIIYKNTLYYTQTLHTDGDGIAK